MLHQIYMKLCLVILFALTASSENLMGLIIIHINDMKSRYQPINEHYVRCKTEASKCYGGFARVSHFVKTEKEKARRGIIPPVLFLNAGGSEAGSAWHYVHGYKMSAEFLNLMGVDVSCLGNQDFDFAGSRGVLDLLKHLKFPIVTSGPRDASTQSFKKSTIISVNGYKIGIIGYITPEMHHHGSSAYARTIAFVDEIENINKEARRLRRMGIKTLFALGYSGFSLDKSIAFDCQHVDLVVGGKSRLFLYNGRQPDTESVDGPYPTIITQIRGKKVPIVQTYGYTKYIGKLHLIIDKNSGEIKSFHGNQILLNSSYEEDQIIIDILEKKYKPAILELQTKKFGRTKVTLEGEGSVCERQECNLGNMIADSFVDYRARHYKGPYWTDAAISLINSGMIKHSIARGEITEAELADIMPYREPILAMTLKGKDLVDVIEHSGSTLGKRDCNAFLQYSGVQVKYDIRRKPRKRALTIYLRCAECNTPKYSLLRKDKEYRILISEYLARGGDGYRWFADYGKNITVIANIDMTIMKRYLETLDIIYPGNENRIVILGISSHNCVPNLFIIATVFKSFYDLH